jgi:glycosyltransferase involved in cell wall biosynthesis
MNIFLEYLIIKKSGLFDANYYYEQYPDVRRADMDPLWHYVKWGWKEGRDPNKIFKTSLYLSEYHDVFNARLNPFVHYIRFGKAEGRKGIPEINHSPINATSSITESSNDIYADQHQEWRQKAIDKFLSYTQKKNFSYKLNYLMLLPLFSMGGGELVTMDFIYTIIHENKQNGILLLVTDKNYIKNSFDIPENVLIIVLDEFLESITYSSKKVFIFDLINLIRPDVIHNINSDVMWNLIIEKGDHIRSIAKLYSNIFCFQYNMQMERIGYAEQYLQKAIPYLDGLLSDNKRFISDAINEYHLNEYSEKFHCLYTPAQITSLNSPDIVKERINQYPGKRKTRNRLRCVWAGRLDEEKRWSQFLQIVERASCYDFEMYGQAVIDQQKEIPQYPNLNFRGGFKSSIEEFILNDFDVFLFTSRWEGLPTTLIATGSCGIPIIAPVVGGVGEIITTETGYPLPEQATVNDFLEALKEVESDPYEASRRARNLLDLVLSQHSWEQFRNGVLSLPGYLKTIKQ